MDQREFVAYSLALLNASAARTPAVNCGAKCIHDCAILNFPTVIKDTVTAGLNDAMETPPTVMAPANTTDAIAAP